jgi:hypothetical protein
MMISSLASVWLESVIETEWLREVLWCSIGSFALFKERYPDAVAD